MTANQNLLLETDRGLKQKSLSVKRYLNSASKLSFWKKHFANHHYTFIKKGFDWNYWQNVPFSSLNDFAMDGIEARLNDAHSIIQQHTKRFVLRTANRETQGQNALFLELIPKQMARKTMLKWRIQVIESYTSFLQDVLVSIQGNKKTSRFIIINSNSVDYRMKHALSGFETYAIISYPASLLKFVDVFSDKDFLSSINTVILRRRFENKKQEKYLKEVLQNSTIRIIPDFMGVNSALKHCRYAEKDLGLHAVHPRKFALIELINIDSSGLGEVVITTVKPINLSLIRYKPGMFGTAVFKKCKCKADCTLILERRRKNQFTLADLNKGEYNYVLSRK